MNKLDIVSLTTDEFGELRKQFYDIWKSEPLKLNSFFDSNEFALNDFSVLLFGGKEKKLDFKVDFHYNPYKKKLLIEDEKHGYQGEVSNLRVITDIYSNHKGDLCSDLSIGYESSKHKEVLLQGCKLAKSIKTPQNWINDLAILFYAFNMLVVSLPHKLIKSDDKVEKTIQVKKGNKKIYKSVVYLRTTYSLKPNFKLTKSDITHIIKCPAWGVRGHYRHLSNGSVIFIKPYVKGKYRNDPTKYVAKTYKT